MAQSFTLQTNDTIVGSGDRLGQLQFAASAELDGGASNYVISQIYAQAEGIFNTGQNPASLVFSTSSADNLPASAKLKISDKGHFIPLQDNTYDLGDANYRFRHLYVADNVVSPTGELTYLYFDTTIGDVDQVAGQLNWNSEAGTIDLGLTDDLTIHLGQSVLFRVKNSTGSTITKGEAVYASGVLGGGQVIQVAPFAADESVDEVRFIGLMTDDLANGEDGFVNHFGHIKNVDLRTSNTALNPNGETWNIGDILFVDDTSPGGLTKVQPKDDIYVALVLADGQNGELFVRITDPGHINDLHDVNTSGLADNNFLVWNSGTDVFEPSSGLYYVDGELGIGIAAPSGKLHVVGEAYVDNLKLDGNTLSATNTNGSIIITPNASGALQADSGGDARGTNAIDWQMVRSSGTQVASGAYSVIGGGAYNIASGCYSTVSGGGGCRLGILNYKNNATGPWSTVSGGGGNTASGYISTVGGGVCNTASGACSTVSGGYCNNASESSSTVGGGSSNCAFGQHSVIGGGQKNIACQTAVVSGGLCNCAIGNLSIVSGGFKNNATGTSSTISGGNANTANGTLSTVSGGSSNCACARYSSISGGYKNFVNARHGSINGGHFNVIQSPTNECCARGATIGGGIGHNTTCGAVDGATGEITGAVTCCNAGRFSTISGGLRNIATGECSTIAGGTVNCATNACSTVGGGSGNTASGGGSTVSGGKCNEASGGGSTVAGGGEVSFGIDYGNKARGAYSSIGGGAGNLASCSFSTVGGGYCNTAGRNYSTVSGGYCNTASGDYSTIAGGRSNTLSGLYSFAVGKTNTDAGYQFVNLLGSGLTATQGHTTYTENLNASGVITATGGNSTEWNEAYDWINSSGVDGSGAANHIAYWSDSNSITYDSGNLYWDSSNNRLGIGTSSPSYSLDVNGSIILNTTDSYIFGQNTNNYIRFYDPLDYIILGSDGGIRFDSDIILQKNPNFNIWGASKNFQFMDFFGAAYDGYSQVIRFYKPIVLETGSAIISRDDTEIRIDSNNNSTTSVFKITKDSGTELMRINEAGNLGIGTNSPQQKLHIDNGNVRVENTTPVIEFHDTSAVGADISFVNDGLVLSHADVTGDNQLVIASNSGVGIGTNAPTATLHAYSPVPSSTVFNVEGTNGSLFSVVDNLSGVLMSVNNNAGLPVFEVYDDDSIIAGRFAQNDFVVSSGGNVGMGVASPVSKLHVDGDIVLGSGNLNRGLYIYGNQTNKRTVLKNVNGSSYLSYLFGSQNLNLGGPSPTEHPFLNINYYAGSSVGGSHHFYVSPSGDVEIATITSSGVGIGTSAPQTLLDVSGVITATGGDSDEWNEAYDWVSASGGLPFASGTGAATRLAYWNSANALTSDSKLTYTSDSRLVLDTNGTGGGIFIKSYGTDIGSITVPASTYLSWNTASNKGHGFVVGNSLKMLIDTNGRVGINNPSPAYTLDVAGTANITGDVIVGGNVTVNGTTVSANVDTMEVADPILTLGLSSGNIVTNTNLDRGMALALNDGVMGFMGWDTSANSFTLLSSGIASNGSGNYAPGTYGDLNVGDTVIHQTTNGTGGLYIKTGNYTHSITAGSNGYNLDISSAGYMNFNINGSPRAYYFNANGSARYIMTEDSFAPSHAANAGYTLATRHDGYFGFFSAGTTQNHKSISLHDRTGNYDYGLALHYMASGVGVGLTKGLVLDNRGLVGIGTENPLYNLDVVGTGNFSGDIRSSGNIVAPNIGADTDNSVVILNSAGLLKTDEIDSRVWGSTLADMDDIAYVSGLAVGASGVNGTGSSGQVAFWTDTNTISNDTDLVWDSGTNRLGVGISAPSGTLHIVGEAHVDNLKLDGNTLSATNTDGNLVLNPQGSGALQAYDDGVANNIRGAYAVDWSRNQPYTGAVAKGCYSTIGGGYQNGTDTSACYSVIGGGYLNATFGNSSVIAGGYFNRACAESFLGGGIQNCAVGYRTSVVGGSNNCAAGSWSTIGGGLNNIVTGHTGTIAGGTGNCVSNCRGFIGGGRNNCITQIEAVVVGGAYNTSSGCYAGIVAGSGNIASGAYSFVGGGYNNCANANCSNVSGGLTNKADGCATFVGGGRSNWAYGSHSAIVGGQNNYTSSILSFVGGGYANCTQGNCAGVVAGERNCAYGSHSFVGGGSYNKACGACSFVGGGFCNCATGLSSVITGGTCNSASNNSFIGSADNSFATGRGAVISGYAGTACAMSFSGNGYASRAYGYASFIGTGCVNLTYAGFSSIVNGLSNQIEASGTFGFIGGGCSNLICGNDSCYAVIGGGFDNLVTNSYATVGGGYTNCATGPFSVVAGGQSNRSTGYYSVISGGTNNCAISDWSTVSGGRLNCANSGYSFVGGGRQNTASNNYTSVIGGCNNNVYCCYGFIGGGTLNVASGDYSAVVAGSGNVVSGPYSFIGGGNCNVTCSYACSSTVSGGCSNTASGEYATIGGGCGNTASGYYASTVGGGKGNTASGIYGGSTVSGGYNNTAADDYATVGGGHTNCAADNMSTVGGGSRNIAYKPYSTVGGGHCNTASASGYYGGATVAGGKCNTASADCSTVSGGYQNTASADSSTVSGGYQNTASGSYSTISGGCTNSIAASGTFGFIGGGCSNLICGDISCYAVIGGGVLNKVRENSIAGFIGAGSGNLIYGDYSIACNASIVGGSNNTVYRTPNAAIVGGFCNRINLYGSNGFIGGGSCNLASHNDTVVTGGFCNVSSCNYAAIGGGRSNSATNQYTAIGGGNSNTASGYAATIGGGKQNCATLTYSTVGGGATNCSTHYYTTVAGGLQNTASNVYATVGGGYQNKATNIGSNVAGGRGNFACGDYASVGGGLRNCVYGLGEIIAGGVDNIIQASGTYGFIGGGCSNLICGDCSCYAVIAGGFDNTASNVYATVGGGRLNVASGCCSTIGGGRSNTASESNSTVGGGRQNTAGEWYATVGGGWSNCATEQCSTIGGGYLNTSSSTATTVAGGHGNTASGGRSFVGGGRTNTASGACSTVGGGRENCAACSYSAVVGGLLNVASGDYSAVVAGSGNIVSGAYSFIGGGYSNLVSGASSTIAGGYDNTASGGCSTVGGGRLNTASGNYSIVSGGYGNTASGLLSTVGGGDDNCASSTYSTVGGGYGNRASANCATVGGGRSNCACATNSSISGGCKNLVNARHGSINGGHFNVIQSPTDECCSRGATIGGGIGHNTNNGTIDATTGDITGVVTCCNAGAFSTISGGCRNFAPGGFSTIGGGTFNSASACLSTVSGGSYNCSLSTHSTIGGGYCNVACAAESTISGGLLNRTHGNTSTIGGGRSNYACGNCSTVGGGYVNTASGACSTVGGGYSNLVSGITSTISGGYDNCATGDYNAIAGGISNITSGIGSTVAGGRSNQATASYPTVAGGFSNRACGAYSFIGGGCCNCANYNYSFVGGGRNNTASGTYSTIAGGKSNTLSGTYSFTAGYSNNDAGYANVHILGSGITATQADTTYTQNIIADGHLAATTKSFLINHPTRPGHKLQYGSLESPYHGVRLTGRDKITSGWCVVKLPEYIRELVHDNEDVNIQLTNYNHSKTLYVSEVNVAHNEFTIKTDSWFANDLEFYWSFTATRKDIDPLRVEY